MEPKTVSCQSYFEVTSIICKLYSCIHHCINMLLYVLHLQSVPSSADDNVRVDGLL